MGHNISLGIDNFPESLTKWYSESQNVRYGYLRPLSVLTWKTILVLAALLAPEGTECGVVTYLKGVDKFFDLLRLLSSQERSSWPGIHGSSMEEARRKISGHLSSSYQISRTIFDLEMRSCHGG